MTIALDLDTTIVNSADDLSSYTENAGNLTLFGNATVSSGNSDVIESITLAQSNERAAVICAVRESAKTLLVMANDG